MSDLQQYFSKSEKMWLSVSYAMFLLSYWPNFTFPFFALTAKLLFFLLFLRKKGEFRFQSLQSLLSQLPITLLNFGWIFLMASNLKQGFLQAWMQEVFTFLIVVINIAYLYLSFRAIKAVWKDQVFQFLQSKRQESQL